MGNKLAYCYIYAYVRDMILCGERKRETNLLHARMGILLVMTL